MNTIGKILVILNFLFAVIVGLFLVMDFSLRNNWKEAYLDLKNQEKGVVGVSKANETAASKLAADYANAQAKIQELNQQLKDEADKAKAMQDGLIAEKDAAKDEAKNAGIALLEAVKAKQRLTDEIAHLNTVIKDREGAIVKLEADVKLYRNNAVAHEQNFRTAKLRNENLVEQLREITLKLAKLEAGIGGGGGDVAGAMRDPNSPNPPPFAVNGKIEKVDGTDLVVLTLGTDHGLKKGNTLDVYRRFPEAKYLGMVRVIDANHHYSVARVVPTGNAAFRPKLLEGDLVTSKLSKN
ncbi:MAG TPA: hypothetical protein VFE62_06760 [Gemmataceae bacterium]|nr:hypothetical protein [Gemmataceae bacterium]